MSEESLQRRLGLWDVFSVGAGTMISSGLFVLPAIAFAEAGPCVVVAYLLAGVAMVPTLFSQAELTTAMPRAGGSYFFIERALGSAVGMMSGVSDWFAISLKGAFALIGIGAFAELLWPDMTHWHLKLVAVAFALFFIVLNLLSVKETGRFQSFMVLGLLGILGAFLVFSFHSVDVRRFSPFMLRGYAGLFATTGLVFISFAGINKVLNVSEEVRDPGHIVPRGMWLAFVVTCIFYVLVVFVTVGVVPREVLGDPGMLTPISEGARRTMGTTGLIVTAVAAMLAFLTTANAGVLTASRSLLAMSRDGLLPEFLHRTHRRRGTPHLAILVTGTFMILVVIFLKVELLVKTASSMLLLLYILSNLSVIVMRESRLPSYRPLSRAPLYPWLQVAGIVIYLAILTLMGWQPLIIMLAFVVATFIWYLIYVRIRVTRQSAIVHVAERVTARELAGSELGRELQDILLHRDNVLEDRFDRLTRSCNILDLEEELTRDQAFQQIARTLAPSLGLEPSRLEELLHSREKTSSTILRPGLAIPHVIVPGEDRFEILPVRARKGIHFPESGEPVRVMFVLAGSPDQRNYHLRALMAVAQIVQEPDFDRRWSSARNVDELRSIILLATRRRDVPRPD